MDQHIHAAKAVGDLAFVGIVAGTLFNHLPSIAAGLAIIWWCIRLYETKTIRKLLSFMRSHKAP